MCSANSRGFRLKGVDVFALVAEVESALKRLAFQLKHAITFCISDAKGFS